MQTHTLKRHTKRIKHVQIGRGGKRGKTSGRGGKGQTARAGNKRRPELRDIIKRLPKLRGHAAPTLRLKPIVVNCSTLEKYFSAGDRVTLQTLESKRVISMRGGVWPTVKLLGTGDLTKKLTVSGLKISGAARKKIEAVGGTIGA